MLHRAEGDETEFFFFLSRKGFVILSFMDSVGLTLFPLAEVQSRFIQVIRKMAQSQGVSMNEWFVLICDSPTWRPMPSVHCVYFIKYLNLNFNLSIILQPIVHSYNCLESQ